MKGLFSLVKKTSQAQLLAAVFALLMLLGLIPSVRPLARVRTTGRAVPASLSAVPVHSHAPSP